MLRQLRFRLTLICTVITGAVLLIIAVSALSVSENQLEQRNAALFQSNVNAIVYKLQSDSTISNTWLAQTEAGDHLIVDIEDNGQKFEFSGAWAPPTPREILIARAQQQAGALGMDITTPSDASYQTSLVFYTTQGDKGDRYRASVSLLSLHGGWQCVTVLRDMHDEGLLVTRQRILVLSLAAAGIGLLFAFAWWFSGRAIRPVEESQKRQVEFVAAASHELRSPLAVIRTSASALSADPSQAEQFASTIERESERMARLVDDLLLLAGLDAKTWSIHRETLDCDTLLLDAYERYSPIALSCGHRLLLDLPKDSLPVLAGDGQRLSQVLSILIDNALQHTPTGCRVTLRARTEAKALRIEVEDNGPGVPPEHKAKLFNRFYRADKARSSKAHFGLGLSIAKELVGLHNGSLTVCDTPGRGATFVIRLPR